ncbi:MAG: hypothetical protein RSC76_09050 [Oscillospiraceae bacterium]
MDYFYGAMWLIVALLLIFKMSKENKIFYFLGGYFALLGVWWLANAFAPNLHLFEGTMGIILKVISGIALVVIGIFYYRDYQRRKEQK